jgi:F420-non-reducing hydrogenase small subunit
VNKKAKLAIGLGSTCAGCDIYILDLKEKIFDLVGLADIVFWPTAMDFKLKDVEQMGEKEIDISLYHGTIRTSEHEHIAKLLREKSKVMIAFGTCACSGGIPGLCNLFSREEIFETCYRDTPSTVNPEFITPKVEVTKNGYTLTLPELHNDGKALHQVVEVDYYLPGCPPPVALIEKLLPIIDEFLKTGSLPPKGTVIAPEKSVCDECPLTKENKRISRIYRPHEIIPDPKRCLLEQGILCLGPATVGGCGASCPNVAMPCRGCAGPVPGATDQGARALSAIASILGVENEKDFSDQDLQKLVDQVKDPVGTFYRFSLPVALINRRVKRG